MLKGGKSGRGGSGTADSHFAFLGSRERAAIVFQLNDGSWSLTGHVVDSVLITKPVGTLDGIVHVPSPVILVHVSESSIDTTLSRDGVTSCWK